MQLAPLQVNSGDYHGMATAPAPVAAALLQQLFAGYDSESLSAGGLQQLLEAHAALGEGSKREAQQGLHQQLQAKLAQLRKQQQGKAEIQEQQDQQQQQQQQPMLPAAAGAQMQNLPLHHMQLLGSDKGLLLSLSGLIKGMRAAEMNASSAMLRAVCEWGVRLVLGPLAAVQPEAVEAVGLAVWQLAGDDTARQVMSANLSSGGIKLQARTGEGLRG
jgi:flagellar motor protein MotB